MQAVILAAGKGTRMGALTTDTPKTMLVVAGKPILEWIIMSLPPAVDEIIIVVGYFKEKIQNVFGGSFNGKKILYVEQVNPLGGTMDALVAARPLVHDSFLVLNGDGLYATHDIEACMQKSWSFGVVQSEELGASSLVRTNVAGQIEDVIEADVHTGGPGLAGVGPYVLDTRIFSIPPVKLPGREEVGLPQTMVAAARAHAIPVHAVSVSPPLHFTSPEDIQEAERVLGLSTDN